MFWLFTLADQKLHANMSENTLHGYREKVF